MQLNVFFEGGERPIENVIYVIKSNDGQEQARGNTNENGDTLRHWLQSTSNEDNHYVVEILYDEFLLTSISNVKIHPNILQDQKIIVPIPAITEELITFRLFDSELNKIVNSNEKYSILLTDPQNNQYTKAFISKNGEIFFSSLPSNVYSASVLKDGIKDPLWSDTQIAVAGRQDNFDLIQKNIPELIVVPFSGLVSPPVPDQISKPVIYYEKPFKLSCNCVAIQLNDVQDFWLNDVQIKLLNTFSDNQFPVTIGVIAKTIGDDTKLLDIIKNGLKNNRFEIANSSWDNTPITTHDKKGQDGIIKKSSNKILEVFGVDSKVFIPPQNEFNENTISVLKANGYTHLSSSLENDPPPYSLRGESFYRFPANAFNAGFDPIDGLKGNTGEEIFSDVQEGINTHGFAVINMHPQEFAVDMDDVLVNELNLEQFKELETLIQKIKNKNIDVVLIGKINQNVSKIISETSNDSLNQNIFPKWVKNTAGWWRDGNIDNKSFVQAIQFLIKENIIQTSQTSQGSGNSEIPEWIKQNSGWWAEGVISDNEFINGLDFLINQGIINIG